MGGSSIVQAVGPACLLIVAPARIVGLLAMGVLQSRRLAMAVQDTSAWILRTSVAWLLGATIPVAALSIVPNSAHLAIHVAVAAAVAMGATVGAITGTTLVDFAQRRVGEAQRPLGSDS